MIRKRISEQKLKRIVEQAVRRTLNEVKGWTMEKDDITWVNGPEDGASPYIVRLWPGSGYYLPAFGVYSSSDAEESLEKVVAYLEKEGDNSFFCDEYVEDMRHDLNKEGYDDEEIEAELDETFLYVDATMEGAKEPHYVWSENLKWYPYDESRY